MTGPSPPYRSSGATHRGPVRSVNEDAFLARDDIGLWLVADGMGGHERGDFASRTLVQALEAVAAPATASALLHEVRARLLAANRTLREAAAGRPRVVIGSTVVVLLVAAGHFVCLWAGDSRLYLLRDGRMRCMTRDHSLVQELVDSGTITPEEAESHPHANVISRAVGAEDELRLDIVHGRLESTDLLLLCTDGLSKVADDAALGRVLAARTFDAAALVDLALANGTRDNVTALVVGAT